MNRTIPITIPLNVLLLMVSESVLITGCYLLAAYWVISELEIYLLYDSGLLQIVLTDRSDR